MAISRSLMNRQLQASGGIMDVSPREKFGLGSKLKKFVRKIIPNEVAEIAVKAAPFVAPFNPALAAAMGGLGTFDQTGSISDSLKRSALTYGLGQGSRFLGGAELQGNPFAKGGAFTPSGFMEGFSSPLGDVSGFKLGKPVEGVQSVDQGLKTSDFFESPTYLEEEGLNVIKGGSPNQLSITESIKKIVGPDSTLNERGTEALNLLKRGTKAAFTNLMVKVELQLIKQPFWELQLLQPHMQKQKLWPMKQVLRLQKKNMMKLRRRINKPSMQVTYKISSRVKKTAEE